MNLGFYECLTCIALNKMIKNMSKGGTFVGTWQTTTLPIKGQFRWPVNNSQPSHEGVDLSPSNLVMISFIIFKVHTPNRKFLAVCKPLLWQHALNSL